MMKNSRKRPLLSSKVAPPPPTATTRMLERMLDAGQKKNKKKKLVVTTRKLEDSLKKNIVSKDSTSANRWSHMSSSKTSVGGGGGLASAPSFRTTSTSSVLASRGGLAAAPSFKKSNSVLASKGGLAAAPRFKRKSITEAVSAKPNVRTTSRIVSMDASAKENITVTEKTCCSTQEMKDQEIDPPKRRGTTLENIDTVEDAVTKPLAQSATACDAFTTAPTIPFPPKAARESSSNSSLRLGLKLASKQPRKRMLDSRNTNRAEPVLPPTISDESSVLSLPNLPLPNGESLTASSSADRNCKNKDCSIISTNDSSTMVNQPAPSATEPRITNDSSNRIAADEKQQEWLLQSKASMHTQPPIVLEETKAGFSNAATKKRPVNNDNFVRTNLRNSAGACRGARNKKRMRKFRRYDNDYSQDGDEKKKYKPSSSASAGGQQYVSRMTGLDPLDDYLDGVFHAKSSSKTKTSYNNQEDAPKCARHQKICKLVVVKKNTTGNKGRKFYACSMPRGEQCNHFQWAADTVEEARRTLLKNTSHSSFIARQVAAHVDRFRCLTVPELREEAARRKLSKGGKKQELLIRLAIWARNEIVKVAPHDDEEKLDADNNEGAIDLTKKCNSTNATEDVEIDMEESDDSSDDDSTSSEELELFQDEDGDNDFGEGGDDDDDDDDDDKLVQSSDDTEKGDNSIDESSKDQLEITLTTIFGHDNFREGQKWAIQRCLDGKKSLLVAPTGFGKSLCYVFPAAVMDGVCVVVSPLISLIQDQLRSLPPRVPAATLSGSVTAAATAAILDDVIRKRIKVLFVSPERLASASFRRLFRPTWNPDTKQKERRFPEISLLCIDEAHCASQWAHNFRPCFLRFKSLLRLMNPRSILAITATAGPKVIADISETIGMYPAGTPCRDESNDWLENHDGIKVIKKGRDNIDVSCQFVANHEERLSMLTKILKPRKKHSPDDKKCPYSGSLAGGSVIVYVWRQRDTEVVAEYLNSSGVTGGVVIYHGGMDTTSRGKAQSKFMRGKARICVATVAFGLGIDKADVVGVLHLYLSNSPEHYLQEIGRAGRDGRPAKAIALPVKDEVPFRHSLVHSNLISKSQIKSLLLSVRQQVEAAVGTSDPDDAQRLFHIALPVQSSVLNCDCKAETIETLLSLIEQSGGDDPLLHVEGFNYDSATIALKKRTLKRLAAKEPVAACIQAIAECLDPPIGDASGEGKLEEKGFAAPGSLQRQFLAYSLGSYSFSVVQCANKLGESAEPRNIFAALRRLQSSNELELALDTTAKGRVFHIRLSAKGTCFFRNSNYFDVLVEELTNSLYESFSISADSGASKVLDMHYIMEEIAFASQSNNKVKSDTTGKSPSLVRFQELTSNYFQEGLETQRSLEMNRLMPESFFNIRKNVLETDISSLLRDMPLLIDKKSQDSLLTTPFGDPQAADYTVLCCTKFLHGIDSPRAPVDKFRSHPLFGKWREVQFSSVLESIRKIINAGSRGL